MGLAPFQLPLFFPAKFQLRGKPLSQQSLPHKDDRTPVRGEGTGLRNQPVTRPIVEIRAKPFPAYQTVRGVGRPDAARNRVKGLCVQQQCVGLRPDWT